MSHGRGYTELERLKYCVHSIALATHRLEVSDGPVLSSHVLFQPSPRSPGEPMQDQGSGTTEMHLALSDVILQNAFHCMRRGRGQLLL